MSQEFTFTGSSFEETLPAEVVCSSREESLAKIKEGCPIEEGWTILPCDEPTKGRVGFVAFRMLDNTGRPVIGDPGSQLLNRPLKEENSGYYFFEIFGPRKVVERVLTRDNVVAELEALKKRYLYQCDNPRARYVGVVHFEEEGIANVTYIPLTVCKQTIEYTGEFVKNRNLLPTLSLKQPA